MNFKYTCLILLCALALPAEGQSSTEAGSSQAPPAWLESINPADYMLLAADLNPPFQMDGEISAKAEASELSLATEKGSGTQLVYEFRTQQKIAINQKDCPTTSMSIDVKVFENPEMAASSSHIPKGEQKGEKEWWDPSIFSDSRLDGKAGEANSRISNVDWVVFVDSVGKRKKGPAVQELMIRYKNIVASFSPTMYTEASTTGFGDYSPGDTCSLTSQLAKLWLDKVSQIEPPKMTDLRLQPDHIYLTYDMENNFMPTEIAADKQAVAVQVENAGTEDAKGVQLQLYLQNGESYDPLGSPVAAGDIPAGSSKTVSTFWDLNGKNVQDAVLMAQAFIPGQGDSNQEDNTAAIKANIYYAHNGDRAYSWIDDGYRFENYDFKGRETEEMVEGLLATIAGNINDKTSSLPLMQRLLFPQTFTRFWNYFGTSLKQGSGGHCYGMSATSSLYFEDSSLRPISKKTSQMALEEASTNIAIYHRAQMLPVIKAMVTGDSFNSRDESPAKCHQAIKDSLSGDRRPAIIEFFGKINNNWTGHAVLAYKLIEVEGRDPVVYVYDPNFPESKARPPKPMPQITLMLSQGTWKNPAYMGYSWAYAGRISAHGVFREIPLQDVNSLVPTLKKTIYDMMETLKKANAIMAVLRCPADVVFTDSQGRRIGTLNGQVINEIPGAEVQSSGEVEIYSLPRNSEYQVSISGTGSGEMGFDVIKPENETGLGLVSFQNITLSQGSSFTGTLAAGGEIHALKTGSKEIQPNLEGYLDVGSAEQSLKSRDSEKVGLEPSLPENASEPQDPVEEYIHDLQNPNANIRKEAASALSSLSDPRAIEPLVQVAKNDENSSVRFSAVEALGDFKDSRAVDALIESLGDEDTSVINEAAWSLMSQDKLAVDPLIEALNHQKSSVRAGAAWSLGMINDSRAVDPLIKSLDDENKSVRAMAAFALGKLRDPRAIDHLTKLLSDDEPEVREEASSALKNLGWTAGEENESSQTSQGDTKQTKPNLSSSISSTNSIFSAQKIDEKKGDIVSPDGTRIAYYVRTDAGYHYVIAGPDGKIEDSVYENVRDFVFSLDSQHYAYKATVGDNRMAVVDGKPGQKYNEVYNIVFSQKGGRYAYMADKGDQRVVVVDGKEEGPYDSTNGDPIVSSNGQHVLYTIAKKGTNYVVVDGEIQEERGWGPVVSPDGSRWAYPRSATYVGDPCYIVLDGEVIDLGKDNRVGQMAFSPDGKRFAYDLIPGGDAYGDHIIVVDGVRGKAYPFPGVGKIVFSTDGSRVAYSAKVEDGGFLMVLDGKEGRIYDEIGDPIFSPEGDHLAYVAKDKDGKFAILDGKEGNRYADIWGLTFSKDGRLAYVARDTREGKDVRLVVVDGKEEKPYRYDWYGQGIRSGPVFTPDGGHVVYVANDGGAAEYLVIDGINHTHPWSFKGGLNWGEGSPIIFDGLSQFHYVAENESGTYLVEVRIPAL